MEQEQTITAIQIPVTLLERTKKFAAIQERSMAYIVRKAVEKYLDENEEPQREPAKKGGK